MAKHKPGLESLLTLPGQTVFFESHWPTEPFIVHDLSESVTPLISIPFLHSLDALLNSWPDEIQVHLPDVADESSSVRANAKDARKLFENKMGLLFNNVHTLSPELSLWLKAIHAELGLPAMTYQRCIVYATPDGKGTAPHFDQNINFVLQLTGTKKWWLAPNKTVEHPSQRHTLGQKTDSELESYTEHPWPHKMPSDETAFELKPGSVLFVPQGYWHRTEATGEALSLNFTFSQPSFADLFLAALRSRLLLSPEWREAANGVSSSDAKIREMTEDKLDLLLLGLTSDLPNWIAADIFSATDP